MTKDGSFKRRVRRAARDSGQRYTEALAAIQAASDIVDLSSELRSIGRSDWARIKDLRAKAESSIPAVGPLDVTFSKSLVALYWRLEDHRAAAAMLTRLLAQPLDLETEAWARWGIVDALAASTLLDTDPIDAEEVVQAHRNLVSWGRRALAPERLAWMICDSTMASPWFKTGRTDEWLQLATDLVAATPAVPSNRFDRFHAHSTIMMALLLEDSEYVRASTRPLRERIDDAWKSIQDIDRLLQEDPGWDKTITLTTERFGLEMSIHERAQAIEKLRETGIRAIEYAEAHGAVDPPWLYQHIGCRFYWAQQYDLAIRMFEQYLALGQEDAYMYQCLAASTWETTRDRQKTIEYLRAAARLSPKGSVQPQFEALTEFTNVVADPEFIAAVTSM